MNWNPPRVGEVSILERAPVRILVNVQPPVRHLAVAPANGQPAWTLAVRQIDILPQEPNGLSRTQTAHRHNENEAFDRTSPAAVIGAGGGKLNCLIDADDKIGVHSQPRPAGKCARLALNLTAAANSCERIAVDGDVVPSNSPCPA